jgi:glutamate dehydrogenase/leucine dehydrogenase
VLNKSNVERLKTRIVAEGANIPCTPEAEAILAARGVLVLPDFVVNAGGVICAATEYHGGTESSVFTLIEDKIRRNTLSVLEELRGKDISMRAAAEALAIERIRRAARARRWR